MAKGKAAPTSKPKGRFVKGIRVPVDAKLTFLSSIRPFPDNPRDHPEEEIAALSAFIMEVGFIVPVVIDAAGNVAAGHARILAALRLGMDRIPTTRVEYLTEKQRLAFVVADNKLPAMARWNPAKLAAVLDDIKSDYPDLRLVGFSDEDMRRLRDDLDRIRLDDGPGRSGGDARAGRQEERGGAEPARDGEDEVDLVPFSVLITPEEREEIYAGIRKVKDRDGGNHSGAALLTIIREWKP